jgi:hypothetical protein
LSAVQGRGKPRFKKVFIGDCRIYGKKGHKATDCWKSDKNKDKRPSNYKSTSTGRSDKSDDKKSIIVLIVTKMVTPLIAVSVKSVMRRKMTNKKMQIW